VSKQAGVDNGYSSLYIAVKDGLAGIGSEVGDTTWNVATGKTKINDGAWHHMAAVKYDDRWLLLLDGNLEVQILGRKNYSEATHWRVGEFPQQPRIAVRMCRVRNTDKAEYLIPFTPERDYGRFKDSQLPRGSADRENQK
jgi:hypothetical protein